MSHIQKNSSIIKTKKSNKVSPLFVVLFVVLFIYVLSMIMLISWGAYTAVKSPGEFNRVSAVLPPKGAPWNWKWSNYLTVFQEFQVSVTVKGVEMYRTIPQMAWFTILYSVGGALVSTIVPCIVAYAAAKFKYKFSAFLYGIVIITMILPIVGSAASEITLLHRLNLYDKIWGNWIQRANFLGMYFLVFHAAYKSLPDGLSEAAYVDGASEWVVMSRIILPLVRTTFFTVALIKFVDFWNDYQTPYLYLPSYPTLAYGVFMMSLTSNGAMSSIPMRMGACMILLIPVLIIFILFRNQIMGNITMGGLKE